jgi:hypothetical protein
MRWLLESLPYFLVADLLKEEPPASSFSAEKLDTPDPGRRYSTAEILASARRQPSNTTETTVLDDYRGPVEATLQTKKSKPPQPIDTRVYHFPNKVKILFEPPMSIESGETILLTFRPGNRR